MFKLVYLPDPTNGTFDYGVFHNTREEAQRFLIFWEGSDAYLWEVMEV